MTNKHDLNSYNLKYIIVIRNPLSRFTSAYNGLRQYDDEGPRKKWLASKLWKKRWNTEKTILSKYNTLNHLAENIYDAHGNLELDFHNEQFYIHHIFEDISFYLNPIINQLNQQNVIGVIATETINEDMSKCFDISITSHEKKNKKIIKLSEKGRKNIIKFLKSDYSVINKLFKLNLITEKQYLFLSKTTLD